MTINAGQVYGNLESEPILNDIKTVIKKIITGQENQTKPIELSYIIEKIIEHRQ